MAIARTQAVSLNATSVAITSTNNGDLIVVLSYNQSTATIPTLAAGFTTIVSQAGTLQAALVAYKISTGGDTTSGTWTNASHVVCMVYSGVSSIGAAPTINQGSTNQLVYPAVSLTVTSGTSVVAAFGGAKAATAGMNGSVGPLTNRTSLGKVNGLDTAAVSSFTAQTLTITGSGNSLASTVELVASTGGTLFTQTLTATFAPTAAIVKTVIDAGFAATQSFAGFLAASKSFLRSLAATLSFTAAVSVSKSFLRAFSAVLSFTGTVSTAAVHFFTRGFAATLSFVGTITRIRLITRVFAATLNMTGAIKRQIGKSFSATIGFLAVSRKSIRKGLGAVLSFFGSLFREIPFKIFAGQVTGTDPVIASAKSTIRISVTGSRLTVVKTKAP